MFATPVVHALRGHGSRAGASYLLRSAFVSVGFVAATQVGCAREPGWFCGFGAELAIGVAGGFAVASALDAVLLHRGSSTWTPTVTHSEGGARIGIATTF